MRNFSKKVTEYTCTALINGVEKQVRVYGPAAMTTAELLRDVLAQTGAKSASILSTEIKPVSFKINYYDLPRFGERVAN